MRRSSNEGRMSLCTYFVWRETTKHHHKLGLGTSVVGCDDDDGCFSLLPIRFFFVTVFLACLGWVGRLTQHTNFSARSLTTAVVVAVVIIADHRFPLAIAVSQFSRGKMQRCRENGKILTFSDHRHTFTVGWNSKGFNSFRQQLRVSAFN